MLLYETHTALGIDIRRSNSQGQIEMFERLIVHLGDEFEFSSEVAECEDELSFLFVVCTGIIRFCLWELRFELLDCVGGELGILQSLRVGEKDLVIIILWLSLNSHLKGIDSIWDEIQEEFFSPCLKVLIW